MKVVSRISAITILPVGKPIFDSEATTVRVEDDAAGPFLEIAQCTEDKGDQVIRLCFTEIDELHKAMLCLKAEWESK